MRGLHSRATSATNSPPSSPEAQRIEDIYTRFRNLEAHARRLLKKAEAPPVPENRPRRGYAPLDPNDPFWSDPRARDAREDLEVRGGGDPSGGSR